VVIRGLWSFLKYDARLWAKVFVAATAALVTLLVSDNIMPFTNSPYYQPVGELGGR
jgi:hypothetical protein